MQPCSILLVDDDPGFRALVQKLLQRWRPAEQYRLITAEDVSGARRQLRLASFHVVFLDLALKGRRDAGFQILEEMRTRDFISEVVVMSSSGSFASVQQAMRLGASDYLLKGFAPGEFIYALEQALNRSRWRGMEKRLLEESSRDLERYRLIGDSPQMRNLRESIAKLASTGVPVLLEAETGSGKELVARNLHLQGGDPAAPFVALDCGTIPATMAESILFGHEKGAFTGADAMRVGIFEQANGGTLFLDEITSLSLEVQNKLLRAIQEREVRRVGGRQLIPVNFRLITAANRSLEQLVAEGKFKQDLFFRINVIQLSLPPLRERMQDLPLMVQSFMPDKKISSKLSELFKSYSWPGNVRELKNFLLACSAMAGENSEISLQNLPETMLRRFYQNARPSALTPLNSDWRGRLEANIAMAERDVLATVYNEARGNISEMARILRLDRSHLHQKLVVYKIHVIRST